MSDRPLCKSDRDGDCDWSECPQLRDGEPKATGRSCPLYPWDDDDAARLLHHAGGVICPVHRCPEPCSTCTAYIAAGL